MDIQKFNASEYKGKIQDAVLLANSMRTEKDNVQDVSFGEVIKTKFGVSQEEFYENLGINPYTDTIQNLTTTGDLDVRWIIPEIFRDALRLGLQKAPIWNNVIASESQVSGLTTIMPYINTSDAAPRRVGEAETIPTGSISYGSKTVEIFKVGRGIKIPYEVMQYATLDVVSLFLTDFGKQLGLALDTLALDTIINGEQTDGSASSPVIGVGTAGTKVYADYLRIWIRMARIGRLPNTIIGGEAAALETLDLAEFKTNNVGGNAGAGLPTSSALDIKTPIPKKSNYYIHGNVPADQEIILDPSSTLVKFNAQPLLVESEKIVSNQTEGFYASLTTGFAKLFRDSAVVMDKSDTIGNLPFPAYMDVDSFENVVIN
jgi:hypothetical protein